MEEVACNSPAWCRSVHLLDHAEFTVHMPKTKTGTFQMPYTYMPIMPVTGERSSRYNRAMRSAEPPYMGCWKGGDAGREGGSFPLHRKVVLYLHYKLYTTEAIVPSLSSQDLISLIEPGIRFYVHI